MNEMLAKWTISTDDAVAIYRNSRHIASDNERMAAIRGEVAQMLESRGTVFSSFDLMNDTPALASAVQAVAFSKRTSTTSGLSITKGNGHDTYRRQYSSQY